MNDLGGENTCNAPKVNKSYRRDILGQTTDMTPNDWVPKPGEWPVDPQEDQPVSKDRIWLDGCFDFSHHGKKKTVCESGARD